MMKITTDITTALAVMANREQLDNEQVITDVTEIMKSVRADKDQALKKYTAKFDNVSLDTIAISKEQIAKAYEQVDSDFVKVMKKAINNIEQYHKRTLLSSWTWDKEPGVSLGQKVTPLERVGIYVPGGTAAYPSSVHLANQQNESHPHRRKARRYASRTMDQSW